MSKETDDWGAARTIETPDCARTRGGLEFRAPCQANRRVATVTSKYTTSSMSFRLKASPALGVAGRTEAGEGMNVGGPGSWPIKGLSLVSCTSSAREHQHDDEAGGDNCGLQIQREREVGGCIEEGEEITHPAIPVG